MGIKVEPDFKESINLVADKDLDFDIRNSSINHTKYVISKIVEKTKNQINIFSDTLRKDIYFDSDVIKSFKKNNKIKINILLNRLNQEDINELKEMTKNNKIDAQQIKPNTDESSYFIVSDEKRVKLQSPDNSTKARVNFNKPDLALHLNNFFNTYWVNKK